MFDFTQTLVNDLSQLLEYADDYDILLCIGDKEEMKTSSESYAVFYAHSFLLRARNPYFQRALSKEWAHREENGMMIFKKTNIMPNIFEILLKFLYTSTIINLEDLKSPEIMNLLHASDELQIQEIFQYCQTFLLENRETWLQQNLLKVSKMFSNNKRFTELYDKMFYIEPERILTCPEIEVLEERELISLLRRGDVLELKQVEIWNSMIRWGISKTGQLKSTDIAEWTTENFCELKKTLKNCLSLIEYFKISKDEYVFKVVPFEQVLPQKLKKQLKEFHLNQVTKLLPFENLRFQTILRSQEAHLISYWMNKKETISFDKNSQSQLIEHRFNLIFKANRDGFATSRFLQKCVNIYPTIALIKIRGSERIIGGYNPTYWAEGPFYSKIQQTPNWNWKESLFNRRKSEDKSNISYQENYSLERYVSKDSFLFSFPEDSTNIIQDSVISHYVDDDFWVFADYDEDTLYGIRFGNDLFLPV
ncbi:5414_t:CDS:2 [Ambispora gerdemannii]|uniref:5414_t:CDS:1 n=1 Tax=Ambispora gerdemannii TaxID=144530 RepID=A0A9N9AKL0_9GLOM|nr:5414_t:CDS:2 [Ambispora gerdemannii]